MFTPVGKKKLLIEQKFTKSLKERQPSIIISDQKDSGSVGSEDEGSQRRERRIREKDNKDAYNSVATKSNLEQALKDDGQLGVIMNRILAATSRYRPSKDAVVLKAFQSKKIDYVNFRNYLSSAFWLSFDDDEFALLIDFFAPQRDGFINGYEFMIAFIKLGAMRKDREALQIREKQESYEAKIKLKEEIKETEKIKKMEIAADFNFSEDIRETALRKLNHAAFKFDQNHPACPSVKSLDVVYLKPAEFKEKLKLILNLKVDRSELGAILKEFDPEITNEKVPASLFLRFFIRLGIDLRDEARAKQREKQTKLEQKAAEESARKIAEVEGRLKLELDFNFQESDIISVAEKFRNASAKYYKNAPGSIALDGFEAESLEPFAFKDLVRRVFNINLSSTELGYVIKKYDDKKEGRIYCKTFLNDFMRIGQETRHKTHSEQLQKQRRMNQQAEEDHIKKIEAVQNSETVLIDMKFNESDLASAMEKLTTASTKYDKVRGVSLTSFEPQNLSPLEFKKALKRTFNLKLSAKEMGATVNYFDVDGTQRVHCQSFMTTFITLGAAEKGKVRSEQLKSQREAIEKQREDNERKRRNMEEKILYDVSFDFSEEDHNSALRKLTEAAIKYDPGHPAAMSLQGFEKKRMLGGELKELVRRTFNLKLSAPEVGAIFHYFEKSKGEDDGDSINSTVVGDSIDCGEFLRYFLQLGIRERAKLFSQHLEKQRRENAEREALHKKKVTELATRANFQVDFDYSEEDKKNIMDRITVAAEKFDKNHPAAPSLEAFEVLYLPPGIFRENLKRVFGVLASPKEVGYLMHLFDQDNRGEINSKEFLLKFQAIGKKMRFEKRASFLKEKRAIEKQRRIEEEKKLNHLLDKAALKVDYDFTADDFQSALAKMIVASEKYDKTHPAAPNLSGFTDGSIKPGVFREQMKRAFNIIFTSKELGAVVSKFQVRGSESIRPSEDNDSKSRNARKVAPMVDGKKFLVYFMRLGFDARARTKSLTLEKQRKAKQQMIKEQQMKVQANMQRVAFDVNLDDFKPDDRASAMQKLITASAFYDKNSPGCVSLDAFDAAFLLPGMFREVLKNTLNIVLTKQELASLIAEFNNGRGNVDSQKFLVFFIKSGSDERDKVKAIQLEKQRRQDLMRKTEHEVKMKKAEEKMLLKVSYEYTDDEKDEAFRKIAVSAKKYDKAHPASMSLDGFEEKTMKPHVFREMLKRTFGLILSPAELGACLHYFDPRGTGVVESQKFLIYFLKLGIAERAKDQSASLQKIREDAKIREKEHEEKMIAQWSKMELKINFDFTEEQRISAFEKLTIAASKFDPAAPGPMGLTAFQGKTMTPAIFREMLKRSFNMKVTDEELAALVTEFDKEKTKTVHCAEFMLRFNTLGVEKRSEFRSKQLEKQRMMNYNAEKEAIEKKLQADAKMDASIDMNYSHDDFTNALEKIRKVAENYDKSHPSAPSLQGFVGPSMRPAEFRDMLMRTFHLAVTDRELGALLTFFQVEIEDEDDEEEESDEEESESESESETEKNKNETENEKNGKKKKAKFRRRKTEIFTNRIDNRQFLQYFNKIQREEAAKRHTGRLERERAQKAEERKKRQIEANFKRQQELERLIFTGEDEESFLDKIRQAAQDHAIDPGVYIESLQGFKGPALPPDKFRDLFAKIFTIKLTFPEIGVLLSIIDLAGLGSIDGSKFLNWFYKLSRIEEKFLLGETVEPLSLGTLRSSSGASPTRRKLDKSTTKRPKSSFNKSQDSSLSRTGSPQLLQISIIPEETQNKPIKSMSTEQKKRLEREKEDAKPRAKSLRHRFSLIPDDSSIAESTGASVQAESFTNATLTQHWILPSIASVSSIGGGDSVSSPMTYQDSLSEWGPDPDAVAGKHAREHLLNIFSATALSAFEDRGSSSRGGDPRERHLQTESTPFLPSIHDNNSGLSASWSGPSASLKTSTGQKSRRNLKSSPVPSSNNNSKNSNRGKKSIRKQGVEEGQMMAPPLLLNTGNISSSETDLELNMMTKQRIRAQVKKETSQYNKDHNNLDRNNLGSAPTTDNIDYPYPDEGDFLNAEGPKELDDEVFFQALFDASKASERAVGRDVPPRKRNVLELGKPQDPLSRLERVKSHYRESNIAVTRAKLEEQQRKLPGKNPVKKVGKKGKKSDQSSLLIPVVSSSLDNESVTSHYNSVTTLKSQKTMLSLEPNSEGGGFFFPSLLSGTDALSQAQQQDTGSIASAELENSDNESIGLIKHDIPNIDIAGGLEPTEDEIDFLQRILQ